MAVSLITEATTLDHERGPIKGNIVLSRDIAATPSQIWEVLGDFPNVADWSAGVKKSYATNDQNQGVGAKRHCDLVPAGQVEETVQGWTPNEQLVVSIDSSKKSRIKHALATFNLSPVDDGKTTVAVDVDFEPKWGPVGKLMTGTVEKQLTKAFGGIFRDLETAASSAV